MLNNNYSELIEKLKINRKWFLILGILLVIGGLLALTYTLAATIFAMYFLGGFLIATGVLQLAHSFYVKQTTGLFIFSVIWSVVYLIAGILILIAPIQATMFLTLLLGFTLIIFGASRLASGFMLRKMIGSGWIMLTGVFNILFGLLIITGWPSSSLVIFGVFIGVDLLMQGVCFIMVYMSIKKNALES